MQNNEDALNRIVNRFSAGLQGDVRKAIKRMYNLLDHGTKVEKATSILQNEYPKLFQLAGLEDALVEAAAYGYGIMPEVMTTDDEEIISSVVRKPWSADGMTLSEKLHGTSEAMRRAIIETVTEQVRKNATTIQMARELYNGYNSGVGVINQQKLPAYINRMVRNQGGEGNRRAIEKAVKNVEKQAQNGAPNRAQKAAYKQLIDAVEQGNEKAIEKAVKVAIEEKTRYVAERIARTEMAKAYADGFFSKWDKDDDAVAYQFKLGTRHPKFDICDMFASCDMFNLGVGVYPKDQVPDVPIHPHCLCKYKVLFKGQVKMNNQRDQRTEAMAKWVDGMSEKQAKTALGKKLYEDIVEPSSNAILDISGPQFREIDLAEEHRHIQKPNEINDLSLNYDLVNSKAYHDKFDSLPLNKVVREKLYNESLTILEHRQGTEFEDVIALDCKTGKLIAETRNSPIPEATGFTTEQCNDILSNANNIVLLHNHPHSSMPSITDIKTMMGLKNVESSVVSGHNGTVYIMTKPKTNIDIDSIYEKWYNEAKDNLGDKKAAERSATYAVLNGGYFDFKEL